VYLECYHRVSRATKEDSMDATTFEAYKILHGRRYIAMMDD